MLSCAAGALPRRGQLVWNLFYATAIARLIYLRRPQPLPPVGDLPGLAEYWKAHFNTAAGGGTAEDFIRRAGPYIRDLSARSET